MKTLFAVSENYPKLRASENYQCLQDNLKEPEDNITKYRETYNQSIMNYNTLIQTFPTLLVSGLFGFKEKELFQAIAQIVVVLLSHLENSYRNPTYQSF